MRGKPPSKFKKSTPEFRDSSVFKGARFFVDAGDREFRDNSVFKGARFFGDVGKKLIHRHLGH